MFKSYSTQAIGLQMPQVKVTEYIFVEKFEYNVTKFKNVRDCHVNDDHFVGSHQRYGTCKWNQKPFYELLKIRFQAGRRVDYENERARTSK